MRIFKKSHEKEKLFIQIAYILIKQYFEVTDAEAQLFLEDLLIKMDNNKLRVK